MSRLSNIVLIQISSLCFPWNQLILAEERAENPAQFMLTPQEADEIIQNGADQVLIERTIDFIFSQRENKEFKALFARLLTGRVHREIAIASLRRRLDEGENIFHILKNEPDAKVRSILLALLPLVNDEKYALEEPLRRFAETVSSQVSKRMTLVAFERMIDLQDESIAMLKRLALPVVSGVHDSVSVHAQEALLQRTPKFGGTPDGMLERMGNARGQQRWVYLLQGARRFLEFNDQQRLAYVEFLDRYRIKQEVLVNRCGSLIFNSIGWEFFSLTQGFKGLTPSLIRHFLRKNASLDLIRDEVVFRVTEEPFAETLNANEVMAAFVLTQAHKDVSHIVGNLANDLLVTVDATRLIKTFKRSKDDFEREKLRAITKVLLGIRRYLLFYDEQLPRLRKVFGLELPAKPGELTPLEKINSDQKDLILEGIQAVTLKKPEAASVTGADLFRLLTFNSNEVIEKTLAAFRNVDLDYEVQKKLIEFVESEPEESLATSALSFVAMRTSHTHETTLMLLRKIEDPRSEVSIRAFHFLAQVKLQEVFSDDEKRWPKVIEVINDRLRSENLDVATAVIRKLDQAVLLDLPLDNVDREALHRALSGTRQVNAVIRNRIKTLLNGTPVTIQTAVEEADVGYEARFESSLIRAEKSDMKLATRLNEAEKLVMVQLAGKQRERFVNSINAILHLTQGDLVLQRRAKKVYFDLHGVEAPSSIGCSGIFN